MQVNAIINGLLYNELFKRVKGREGNYGLHIFVMTVH